LVLRRLTSMKASRFPLSATRSIDRGSIALRHDAVAFEAKQECCQGLGKQPAAMGFCPRLLHVNRP
jgi:hypothetical protein